MDIVSGLSFLFLASAIYAGSYAIRTFSDTGYGVTFVPRLTAILMACISVIVIAKGIFELRNASGEGSSISVPSPVWATGAVIFCYIFCIEKLGFILCSIIYISLQCWILSGYSRKHLLISTLLAVPFSVGVYILFTRIIYVMLPSGILGW